ncbi:hypothetical protein Sps_04206 [Shewanella psychrophila]|uniref:SecDF P1 head subdomain domain-containing protein n=1 Tax=Shewanella psychrophila TaxID=225848 RepID=A0A1S6HV03_9GAMM|nr:hypothetical protein [Shewanella psychrophila]AQS39312.1 hypothetical protein Sps_04206 [Shewanella psychrophila]
MKLFSSYRAILLLCVFSFGASSHDASLSDNDKNSEQVSGAKLSFIWVALIAKDAVSYEEGENDLKSVIAYRGEHYGFLGSEIIGEQDILTLGAHSANAVNIELTQEGADKLSSATANNLGKQMAVLLDGKAVNVATVQSKLGAKMMITGLTEEQVKYLLSGRVN